jgi:hypothetical protein
MFGIEIPQQSPELDTYAAALYSRLGEAAFLRRMVVTIGDWKPEPNECHANATTLHLNSPEYTPVRGWLYFDFGGYLPHVKFLPTLPFEPERVLLELRRERPTYANRFLLAHGSTSREAQMPRVGCPLSGARSDGASRRR